MKIPAHFLTTLQVRRASDDEPGAWELTSALIFHSNILPKVVVVPAGFRTNFASVPRLPVVYTMFGGVADEAAVIHDWLYTSFVHDVTRKQADDVFLEAMGALHEREKLRHRIGLIDRISNPFQRGAMWAAVRLFGGSAWGSGSPLNKVEEEDSPRL